MREKKGITLIALIITIIVMLILAGTIILIAVQEGGIIEKTQAAQTEYEAGKELELIKLSAADAIAEGVGVITKENLEKALDSNFGIGKYSLDSSNIEYFEVEILDSGRKYYIYSNGKIEGPIPPPQNIKLGKATVGIIVKTNSTIDGEMYSSTNPLIPTGFAAVNLGGTWDSEGGPEVDKGLVVRDENGNEFVWVPVETEINPTGYSIIVDEMKYQEPEVHPYDNGNSLLRAACEDKDKNGVIENIDFKIQLEEEYKNMADSINKYKGFYVGRFETSKNGENPQSRRSTAASGSGELIVSVHSSNSKVNDWYEQYALNKKYSTTSVQGSMFWGIQYDSMMNWMGDATNSTITGYNKSRTCGAAPEDVIKNVYDIYGNSSEFTLEWAYSYEDSNGYEKRRVCRSGDYQTSRKPSRKGSTDVSDPWGDRYGSRLALYIK